MGILSNFLPYVPQTRNRPQFVLIIVSGIGLNFFLHLLATPCPLTIKFPEGVLFGLFVYFIYLCFEKILMKSMIHIASKFSLPKNVVSGPRLLHYALKS